MSTTSTAITDLVNIQSLANFSKPWQSVNDSGVITAVCAMSVLLTFGIATFVLIKPILAGRGNKIMEENKALIVKVVIITALFGVPLTYTFWYGNFLNLLTSINNDIFGSVLIRYKTAMNFLISSLLLRTESATGASQIFKSLPFFNVDMMNNNIEMIFVSVITNMIIFTTYLFVVWIPAFVVYVGITGPVILPFSILFPDVAKRWLGLFLSLVFFPLFTSLAFQVLLDTKYIAGVSQFSFDGIFILVIIVGSTILTFTSMLMVIIGYIFGAQGIYNWPAKILALILGCVGLVHIPALVMSVSNALSKKGVK